MGLEVRRLAELDRLPDTFEELGSCDDCNYWEAPMEFDQGIRDPRPKVEWLEGVLSAWGNCGLLAIAEGRVVGFIQYAPNAYFRSRLQEFPSGSASEDSVLITCLHSRDRSQRRRGIGSRLLRAALEDLRPRGYRVVEALA